jgi:ubiquinone/menaquinone biosynthesis C-methylase UbiE
MMKINIGAGDTKLEGYVTLDYDANSNPDYQLDIEKDRFPFEDNTVETVVAHHILEHLGEGYFHCLQEIYRVCKHGAIVDIRVPHPRHDSFLADPTHRRPVTIVGMQLFSKKFNKHCREQGYASSRLGEYFGVDFEVLDYRYIPDEKVRVKFQNFTTEQIEDYANEHNNIISEVHIKLLVNKE